MSIGNTRDVGNKGNNFPFQKSVLVMLGRILNTLTTVTPNTLIMPITGINVNQLLGAVPNGYMVEVVVFQEVSGTAGATLKLGSTPGDDDIMPATIFAASALETISLNYFPSPTTYPVYISSAAWGTSNFKAWLILRKVI